MHRIEFRGKNVYYRSMQELSRKLNIPLRQARNLVNDNGRRIVIDDDNKTFAINIKKDDVGGLLRTNFNIGRINNTKLIDGGEIKGVEIVKELGPNATGKYLIKITMFINFPSPEFIDKGEILNESNKVDKRRVQVLLDEGILVAREMDLVYEGFNDQVPDFVKRQTREYAQNIRRVGGRILYTSFRLLSYYNNRKLKYENGYVRDLNNIFDLSEWANIEYEKDYAGEDTCAVRVISKRFPKLYWNIKKHETKHGIRLINFMNFCKKYSIGYILYDEHGKEFSRCETEDDIGKLNCIIYNNHVYPTTGGKPKRYVSNNLETILVYDSVKKLKKHINNEKVLPSKIKIDTIRRGNRIENISNFNILSYTVRDKKYVCNAEYEECLDILTKMGYDKYIYDSITIRDIPCLLEKILKVNDVSSFIPDNNLFKTSPLLWKTTEEINKKNLRTIDKNKCYSFALYSLPYLIKFDFRKNNIRSRPTEIVDHYLYVAKPNNWTILMPCTKLYAGYFLKDCFNAGVKFELLEELETETVDNYFRQIIKLMYDNMSSQSFKEAMNIFIGKFERSFSKSYEYKYVGIYDDEAIDTKEGFNVRLGNYNLLFKENEQYLHVRDRLPIATQIKDMSRMFIHKKIKELKIRDQDIVQINTDSISYIGALPKYLDPNALEGWKKSEFKELGDVNNFCDQENITVLNIENTNNSKRILHMKYAGSGKTTYIIDKLVPELLKTDKTFIVLTPTHTTLREYKNNNINCEIIQKYVFDNTIPKEDYIIIDEIGFIDRKCHDFLYKINKAGKTFECFGDFNQLLPVGETSSCNQEHYLRYMFNEINNEFINHRNNFTQKYYDKLINNRIDIVKEVNKWSTIDPSKVECILCFRHKTKELYNNKILKSLGFDKWNSIGVYIICTNNRLLNENIYHNKEFFITDIIDEEKNCMYELTSLDDGEIFYLPERRVLSNFEPAYAINIHQAQGMTLKSYYWADEDDNFITGRVAYTIISRLHQKKK
ncbi:helicase domain-containing protein [Mimivirus argentum]|nr:integrase zinc-binding and helicase domain-containing protein [Acanthamoeba castellanii mamavirus]UMZ08537.1 helicase domain-containing protein [Mimivirus argentum]